MGVGATVASAPVRKSVKAFGAISIAHNPRFSFQFSERFNATTFLAFLKRLVKNSRKKVLMVLDNVGYHHAKLVRTWVEANKSQIELHFLPPYSPQYNPIELLWRQTKRMATHNRYFETLENLKQTLFRRFNRYQGNPPSIRSLMAKLVKRLNTCSAH